MPRDLFSDSDMTDSNQQSDQQNGQNLGLIHRNLLNIKEGGKQLGHEIQNIPSNVAGLFSNQLADKLRPQPYTPDPRVNSPLDKLVQGAVASSPYFIAPEFRGLSKIAPSAGLASRLAVPAATGFALSDNPQEGAKHATYIQALSEALPPLARGAGKIAESVYPKKTTADVIDNMVKDYKGARRDAKDLYDPLFQSIGKNPAESESNLLNFTRSDKQYFSPNVKRSYETYKGEPSISNLHNLQSEMFKSAQSAKRTGDNNTYQALTNSRSDAMGVLKGELSKYPGALGQYENAQGIIRDRVTPFTSHPLLQDIVDRGKRTVDPYSLGRALNESAEELSREKSVVPQGHALRYYNDIMSKKLGGALPAIGEATIKVPSINFANKITSGPIVSLIQHPFVQKLAKEANEKRNLLTSIAKAHGLYNQNFNQ